MQNIKLPPGFPFLTVLEGFVKNVCISDVVTGLIFFQKVYKWKESSAFNNLGEWKKKNVPFFRDCWMDCSDGQKHR